MQRGKIKMNMFPTDWCRPKSEGKVGGWGGAGIWVRGLGWGRVMGLGTGVGQGYGFVTRRETER